MAIRTINKHNLINLNINMNFRYNFSENSKADLLEFVKEAQKQKDNKYCDLEQYKLWKKMLPLDSNIEKALEVSKEVIEIMDSESFEELPDIKNTETLNDLVEENINNSIVVEDVTYAIKENLEKIKEVPKSVIRDIEDYPVDKLKGSLMLLSEELNFEDVVNLGNSLVRFNCSESVFSVYFQTLLSTKLRSEYSDKLHSLLFKIESYTNGVLANEISRVLLEEKEGNIRVLMQYIAGFNQITKTAILGAFLKNCKNLCENYFIAIDVLINQSIEFNSINKLIQLLSMEADNFSEDKSLGKLLLSILQYLGKNILLLEQPLKHIICKHQSVWKIKIQKSFTKCMDENLVLSQSFR